ncbi:MAG: molybdopterin-dependent oxidoreductase, partial [Adlercreutzia equolifaciens]
MTDIMDSGQYAGEDYPIKSLFVAAANPMSSGGSSNEILEWWNKIDFIVVSDLQYSDSVKYADIVLPCAHALEVEDVLKGSYYPYVGITEKAVESPAEAKSDSDIARLISVEMEVLSLCPSYQVNL